MARRGGSPEQLFIGIAILIFFVISAIIQKIRAVSPISIILFIVITVSFGLLVYLLIKALKPNQKQTELRSPSFNNSLYKERRPSKVYVEPKVSGQQRADYDYQQQPNFYFSDIRRQSPQETINRDWDVSILKDIEWKRFETVCAEYLKLVGFAATETSIGKDGGVDIRFTKQGEDTFKGIVQCKSWATYKVGVKAIRELFGVMASERISYGIFMTSGEFTADAEDFANGKMKLVSGETFIKHIKKLPEEDQKKLLNIALAGDYKTPTCPQCDVKMVLRESSRGQFWGCPRFPRCRQKFQLKKNKNENHNLYDFT